MSRVLLLTSTTGYQTRAFDDAAEKLGLSLVLASDRCDVLDDPWRDQAIPVRFHEPDASVQGIVDALRDRPIRGVIAVGDRPAVLAARVAAALGVPGHSPDSARAAGNKRLSRDRLRTAGLPVPSFIEMPIAVDPHVLADKVKYPAVVKPLALSGSRGVMRVNDRSEFVSAFERLRALLDSADVRRERHEADRAAVVESFIEGREYAVEGLMWHGRTHVLAIFDKPDPLDGPFFEETIYVTPSAADEVGQSAIAEAVSRAASAIGLTHGPIHAECRVNAHGVWILEVAARPIGGLCARALRFVRPDRSGPLISLEELILREAIGESPEGWVREPSAAGVMMIPIPRRGVLRGVSGVEEARGVPWIEDVRITAKMDQVLVPLPEGASYLGFIFARANRPHDVEQALRDAHQRLVFDVGPEVRVLQSTHG